MTSVRRGLALSFAERYVLIAIGLAGNILIARLLTPEEIGLYSVSLAVIGIAQVLRDFGIGNFLIQVKHLEDGHIRTAFGFSLIIGGTLFVAVFLVAPFAATFYADERLIETMRISALNFFVLPFCTISLSLLRRDMAFARIAIVTVAATVVGFVVTISLAYASFGPNSMAIGAVVTNIVTGAGAWFATSTRRMLLPGLSHWRELIGFGARTSAANIVTSISMDINDLAVGRVLGFASVAMISRAQGLMNLFHRDLMTAIRNVAYPAFAKAHRENIDLEKQHVYAVALITVFAWPFYAFTSLFSLEILRLLFGPQWDAAAPLVPWFCLAGATVATCNLVLPMLIARGRVDLATQADLVIQPIRAILLVIGVIIFQSMEAFAIIFAIVSALSVPYVYYIKSKCQPTDTKLTIDALKRSLLVTMLCLTPSVFITYLWSTSTDMHPVFMLLTAAASCASTWLVAIIVTRHPLCHDPLFQQILSKMKLTWLMRK